MRRSRISQTFRRRIDYRVGALAIGAISTNKPMPLQTQVSVHGRQPDDGGQPLGFSSSSVPAQADSMTYSFVIANQVTEPHRRCSIVSALTGRRLRKFFGAGNPDPARSHHGLSQLCRPGRGVSRRARGGNRSSDHAGRGASAAIGLQLVVELFAFGLGWYVDFFLHGQKRSAEHCYCFVWFVWFVVDYGNGQLVIGGFVGDTGPAHRRREEPGQHANRLDCIQERSGCGVAGRPIAGIVSGQFRS
jgi:hypothetical protein